MIRVGNVDDDTAHRDALLGHPARHDTDHGTPFLVETSEDGSE